MNLSVTPAGAGTISATEVFSFNGEGDDQQHIITNGSETLDLGIFGGTPSWAEQGSYNDYEYELYKLSAVPNPGFKFDHFIITFANANSGYGNKRGGGKEYEEYRNGDVVYENSSNNTILLGERKSGFIPNYQVYGIGKSNFDSQIRLSHYPVDYFSFWEQNFYSSNIVAVFVKKELTVTTESSPSVGGATSGGGNYDLNDQCTITATPNAGYRFVNWTSSAGETATTETHTFTVTQDVTWTAHFELAPSQQYIVTTASEPANAGTTTGGGVYQTGATCTIGAVAKCSPWTFEHWMLSPGGRVVSREHSFQVTSNTSCVAYFSHTNTGLPYYDADGSGAIVCSSSGQIFYDGNLVSPS